MTAELWSKPHCPHCVKAKMILTNRGIPITEMSAIDNRDMLFERVEAETGSPPKTVPQIWLNGEYIGGCKELEEHFARFDTA